MQTPWELIAGVCVNSLEETHGDPDIHGEDVEVAEHRTPEKRRTDCSDPQEENLDWRCVFSGKAEGGSVRVVDLVHVSIDRTPVKRAMRPVVPSVFHDEEDGDLEGHLCPCGEGHARVHTKVFTHGVKEPDLGKLDGEVGEKDHFSATPLLFGGGNFMLRVLVSRAIQPQGGTEREVYLLNLVFPEVGYGINDNPR